MWLRLIGCDVAAACWLVGQTLMVRALASAFIMLYPSCISLVFYVDVVGLARAILLYSSVEDQPLLSATFISIALASMQMFCAARF